jgi:hypothetical protein
MSAIEHANKNGADQMSSITLSNTRTGRRAAEAGYSTDSHRRRGSPDPRCCEIHGEPPIRSQGPAKVTMAKRGRREPNLVTVPFGCDGEECREEAHGRYAMGWSPARPWLLA